MVPSFFGAGLLLGAFLADKLGPTWWRLYWIAVGVFVFRAGAVVWRRLELPRMAAGLVVGAATFATFGLLGGTQRDVSLVIGSHWVWFAMVLIAMCGLFLWEGRHSPERLNVLGTLSRSASLRDRFTLRHIPELRRHRDA